jgi:hypothetical protein
MDLSTKELETLTELELAAFSVLVHCRKYVIALVLSFGDARKSLDVKQTSSSIEESMTRLGSSAVLCLNVPTSGARHVLRLLCLMALCTRVMAPPSSIAL